MGQVNRVTKASKSKIEHMKSECKLKKDGRREQQEKLLKSVFNNDICNRIYVKLSVPM